MPYREVLSGVPQRSVFGPLLSDIFVSDLHSSLKELKYVLFAEGVKNVCTVCSVTDNTSTILSLFSHTVGILLTM